MNSATHKNNGLPILHFKDGKEWKQWLRKNGLTSTGVWLKIAKKGSGEKSVSYAEALDAALCWGWIDGQKGAYDIAWWLQKFTPRGERSIWSKRNRDRAEALTKSGEMQSAGLKAIAAAKRAGEWDRAYKSQRSMDVPSDLQEALAKSPAALKSFMTLNSVNRYAILFRIHAAKKQETRKQRIGKFVAMLKRGETIHPQTRSQR